MRATAACLLALLSPTGASALPPPAQQQHAVLQPEGEQPRHYPFGPPTEYDTTLAHLTHELLEAYHTKDTHNRTSVDPLLSLVATTDVEDDEEF